MNIENRYSNRKPEKPIHKVPYIFTCIKNKNQNNLFILAPNRSRPQNIDAKTNNMLPS